MPTPPGAEVIDTEPITTSSSKRVMLRAERHDEIEISLVVSGTPQIPKKLTVMQRTETYYGPQLTCIPADSDDNTNYMLTCPGPQSQLILWKYITGTENKWRTGVVPISEVQARIDEVKQYNLCEHCGKPLKDLWHERLSALGLCEKIDYGN